MRLLIACLSCVFATLLAIAAPVPKERAEAEKVVGVWKLVKSSKASPPGISVSLEMELTLNGKVILRQSVNGGPVAIYEGEYSVNKTDLPYSIKYPGGGTKKETLTIKKITENEMQLVDPDGIQEDFERVKPKKMEEPKPEKP
jgi:uncharacterized protein (TIGR03066 family)